MKPQWYTSIPSPEVVLTHESYHPRPDGIRLGRITVDDCTDYVKTDSESYGDWIIYHDKSTLHPYISSARLKTVDGTVLIAIGFCQWSPLHKMNWINRCRFFPVGQDGLPINYSVE